MIPQKVPLSYLDRSLSKKWSTPCTASRSRSWKPLIGKMMRTVSTIIIITTIISSSSDLWRPTYTSTSSAERIVVKKERKLSSSSGFFQHMRPTCGLHWTAIEAFQCLTSTSCLCLLDLSFLSLSCLVLTSPSSPCFLVLLVQHTALISFLAFAHRANTTTNVLNVKVLFISIFLQISRRLDLRFGCWGGRLKRGHDMFFSHTIFNPVIVVVAVVVDIDVDVDVDVDGLI